MYQDCLEGSCSCNAQQERGTLVSNLFITLWFRAETLSVEHFPAESQENGSSCSCKRKCTLKRPERNHSRDPPLLFIALSLNVPFKALNRDRNHIYIQIHKRNTQMMTSVVQQMARWLLQSLMSWDLSLQLLSKGNLWAKENGIIRDSKCTGSNLVSRNGSKQTKYCDNFIINTFTEKHWFICWDFHVQSQQEWGSSSSLWLL